jgi:hypothetical protein
VIRGTVKPGHLVRRRSLLVEDVEVERLSIELQRDAVRARIAGAFDRQRVLESFLHHRHRLVCGRLLRHRVHDAIEDQDLERVVHRHFGSSQLLSLEAGAERASEWSFGRGGLPDEEALRAGQDLRNDCDVAQPVECGVVEVDGLTDTPRFLNHTRASLFDLRCHSARLQQRLGADVVLFAQGVHE